MLNSSSRTIGIPTSYTSRIVQKSAGGALQLPLFCSSDLCLHLFPHAVPLRDPVPLWPRGRGFLVSQLFSLAFSLRPDGSWRCVYPVGRGPLWPRVWFSRHALCAFWGPKFSTFDVLHISRHELERTFIWMILNIIPWISPGSLCVWQDIPMIFFFLYCLFLMFAVKPSAAKLRWDIFHCERLAIGTFGGSAASCVPHRHLLAEFDHQWACAQSQWVKSMWTNHLQKSVFFCVWQNWKLKLTHPTRPNEHV